MSAIGRLRRLSGKPVLNSLVPQVPRGATFKLAPAPSRERHAPAQRPDETVPSRQFRNCQGQQR